MLKAVFVDEPLDSWVIMGEQITLPCQPPVGHPRPDIEWKKNGANVETSPDNRSALLSWLVREQQLIIVVDYGLRQPTS